MTTYFPFVPNAQSPFEFQPTLDGQEYTAIVTWNLFGQRYYLNVNQLSGPLVFSLPLLGSPDGAGIQALSWSFGTATAVTAQPHGYMVGQTVLITISGCVPDSYNGTFPALIVDSVTFTYQIAADPGDPTALGTEIYNINLGGVYFTDSTLVFRQSSQTFEVTP